MICDHRKYLTTKASFVGSDTKEKTEYKIHRRPPMMFTKHRVMFLLVIGLVALASLMIAQGSQSKNEFVVEGFTVSDVPADDGTALMLSWKPLHRSKRIIEYRIYRGVSEDQLFFHGSIPVNVRTGVAADTMYYYDSSWGEFVDIKSPGKLRPERQQSADSPLYRKIPRDVEIVAELATKFTVLSVIDKKDYYYRSKLSYSADEADTTAYAGMLLRQQTLLAKLKPGEEYFYTVVAVDEKNNYHSFAPISSAKPVDNPPDPATDFFSVLVEDEQKLQFEWEYPLINDDLYSWQVIMTPDMDPAIWNERSNSRNLEGLGTKPIARGQVSTMGSDAPKNYTIVDVKELLAQGITIEQIKGSRFTLELMDYSSQFSYSRLSALRTVNSDLLPAKPEFAVIDKPNDKGDKLLVVWDNPIVFVNQTTLVGESGKRLRVNYQLNMSETQRVDNIYFDFFKKGDTEPFVSVNEFYIDDKIFITIPADYDYKNGLHVRMTLKTGDVDAEEYVLAQDLEWDEQMLTLMPSKALYRNGVDVSVLGNVVYRKRTNTPFYTNIKKNTSYDNTLEITISYESVIYRIVNGFNYAKGDSLITITSSGRYAKAIDKRPSRSNVALVSADIDLIFDRDNNRTIMTSIYRDEAVKDNSRKLEKANKELQELEEEEKKLQAEADSPQKVMMLAEVNAKLENAKKTVALLTNEHLVHANEIGSNRSRMRYIASIRENDKRKQSYMIVRTDGKGLFAESDLQLDDDGNHVYMIPTSDWFDRNKVTTLVATILFVITVVGFINMSKRGKNLYIRPIAGLSEIDNAIGRATEMGRPMLYCLGAGSISDPATLASLGILGLVAKKAAEYDTKLIVPCYDYMVMPIAQEIVRDAHYEVGRPDSFDKNNVFYLTNAQFAYVAGVNGIMIREKVATNFFLGMFYAETLLMTETGNFVGAVQVAGTDAITQIPFFITTCDYTLIGEELYAASAYLNREPMLLGTLKGADYYKLMIMTFITAGTIFATFQIMHINRLFPAK